MLARPRLAGLAAFSLLALPMAARATIMVPLSVEEMAQEAAVVITGRVLAQQATWDKENRRIYTHTEIEVTERLAGQAPDRVVVKSLGGEVGEIGMHVSGSPRFTVGEEVLLFLRADPVDAGEMQVIGMSQGKFKMVRQPSGEVVVEPSSEGVAFVRRDGTGTYKVDESAKGEGKMTLSALRARVAAAKSAPPAPAPPARPGATITPQAPSGPVAQ